MAWESKLYAVPGLVAGADLRTTGQHRFVKLDNAGRVVLCSAITDLPIGVLQNNPNTNEEAEVLAIGVSKVEADGPVTIGQLIGTAADGQADAIAAGTDTTVYIVGRALEAATGAGQLIAVAINALAPGRAA